MCDQARMHDQVHMCDQQDQKNGGVTNASLGEPCAVSQAESRLATRQPGMAYCVERRDTDQDECSDRTAPVQRVDIIELRRAQCIGSDLWHH